MALTTRNYSERKLAASSARFISSIGPDIHTGLVGSSQYNEQKNLFLPREFHKSLELLLERFLPETLALQFHKDAKKLEELSERLAGASVDYHNRQNGFWHSLWYRIGDSKDAWEGWIALIPNEYGLAVVKTGLAVVFNMAEKSAERRDKVLRTFAAIRDALTRADPVKRSFRTNKDVSNSADNLTQAIVDSIEDMISLISKQEKTWLPKLKLKRRQAVADLDTILERLDDARKNFERVVNLVRDNVIEGTGLMAQSMALRLSFMDRKQDQQVEASREENQMNFKMLVDIFQTKMKEIAEREENIMEYQRATRNEVHQFLCESKRLQQVMNRHSQFRGVHMHSVVITEDQLVQILTGKPVSGDGELRHILQQPSIELERVLSYKGKLNQQIQKRVQASVLRNNRVAQWLNSPNSDIILVDANITVAMPGISAISVFCGTLITSMIRTRPDDVVVYYFCGLHLRPKDEWYGPKGIIRFITMQLLMKLISMQRCDLSFIDKWDDVKALEDHDLLSLCDLLYYLVAQFPEEMTICLIIDSISRFDNPKTSTDLRHVMECFNGIVNDTPYGPSCKILLTNLRRSKISMKQIRVFQDDPTRLVKLTQNALTSMPPVSDRVIGSRLQRDRFDLRYRRREEYAAQYDDIDL